MLKRVVFPVFALFLLFTGSICLLSAEPNSRNGSGISVSITPSAEFPLGTNADYFGTGGSVSLRAGFSPEPVRFLSLIGEFNYMLNPYGDAQFFTALGGGGGIGLNLNLGTVLSLQAFGTAGYSACTLDLTNETVTGGGTYFSGGISGNFNFSPVFSLGISGAYRDILGVYSGVSASLLASLNFNISSKSAPVNTGPVEGNFIKLLELDFTRIFPVFYSYYDEHPMGTAVLYNDQKQPVRDINISFYVNKYMDSPKKCVTIDELPAGGSKSIDLVALFTENMLEITEGMKVAAEITIDYEFNNTRYKDSHTESMQIEFRNAMTWDDDRRAAAFVTAKDPDILSTAKNVAGTLKNVDEFNINQHLLMAMAFHEALRLYGLSYVIDPSSPYEGLSQNESYVDYLQFPRETLEYRAGDCDDLSILYCALFESVGIKTSFITVPGHIFMAFSLDQTKEEAEDTFSRPDDLIFYGGDSWIPLEITCLEDDFLKAWQLGAKEWREFNPQGKTGFFPIHEAWEIYKPIGLPGRNIQLALPSTEMISTQLMPLVQTYVEREIFPQASRIETQIAESVGNLKVRNINKLGILYARYGLEEKALDQFNKILLIQDYIPAFINIGNIYFQDHKMDMALPYYEKALEIEPQNKKALLYTAMANHELENYTAAEDMYSRLKSVDAGFAKEFAYLNLSGEEGSRAADVNAAQTILWEEE